MSESAGQIYRQALKKHWFAYTIGTLTLLMTSVTEVAVPKFIQWTLDLVSGKTVAVDPAARLSELMRWMLLCLVVGLVGRFAWRQILARRTHMEGRELKVRFWDSLRFQPLETFHRYSLGDLMNRATGDWNPSRAIYGFTVVLTLDLIFFTTLALVAMLQISVELTLYCLCVFPFLPRLILKLARREHDLHLVAQDKLSDLTGVVSQAISSVRLSRATASDPMWSQALESRARTYADRRYDVVKTGWKIFPLGAVPTLLAYGVLLVWGIKKITSGELSVGQFVAMQSYILMLQAPLFDMGDCIAEWQKGLASLSRLAEVFGLSSRGTRFLRPGSEPRELGRGGADPALSVAGLSFGYDGGKPVLSRVDLTVKRGEAVGIFGPIGGGKSTLLKLIGGLAEPESGKIKLFGLDVTEVDRGWLAQHVVTVPQRAFLFAGPLRQNLELGESFGDEALWEALSAVCLDGDVRAMSHGLDTWIGEWGVTLSGGQKQRLALARALMRKRDIYLLDDCLSAVDAATEEKILATLRNRVGDAALIWVAHRTSTLRFCDRLYHVEGGVIENASGEAYGATGK